MAIVQKSKAVSRVMSLDQLISRFTFTHELRNFGDVLEKIHTRAFAFRFKSVPVKD